VDLAAGNYYLEIGNGGGDNQQLWAYAVPASGQPDFGNAYVSSNSGATWQQPNNGGKSNVFDLRGTADAAPAPEPATLGIWLIACALVMWKSKKKGDQTIDS